MLKNIHMILIWVIVIIFIGCTVKLGTILTNNKESGITKDQFLEQTSFTNGVWIKKYPGNYACFKFETPNGLKIICDPFNMNEEVSADIITESHQDWDHVDTSKIDLDRPYVIIQIPGLYTKDQITEYLDEELADDISIQGFAGKHNSGDQQDTNHIYLFKINDICIANFASQGELPSEELLNQIGNVDVLLIQLIKNPTSKKLGIEDFKIIMQKLNPKIVIPEHGDKDAGKLIADCLNLTEECITNGNMIINREMLDKMNTVRVINLDN